MPSRAQFYINTSREYYARARGYLAANDLLQTSEKGWGAAALRVKSVAELRGWYHYSHGSLSEVIDRLVEETGDQEYRRLFKLAGALHSNFYEGRMRRRQVSYCLSRVAELIRKLESLAG